VSKISSYAPGSFCWADLMTKDTAAAKNFYAEMFGWTSMDVPAADGIYTILKADGDDVAGMMPARPGMPNCWNVHFSVTSADAMAEAVVRTGGEVLNGPFDAMDAGRMAVVQDPQGAVFCLWEPRKHIGATYGGALGRVVWPELATTDAAGAATFYKGLFGWGSKPETGVESAVYTEWTNGGKSIGGMMPMNGPQWAGIPPHWNSYITVADCDERAAKAVELGSQLYVPPTDIPNVGRFAVVADPQRAVFCIIQMTAAH
jgi:predicted enzyme related to lactoylglutathione lyase